jgi:NDP-sugar pyrophosphorylase family protein
MATYKDLEAKMFDNSRMHDNSKMFNNSKMYDNSEIYDNSRMYDNSILQNNSRMFDNSRMHDNSILQDTELHGNAVIRGEGLIESVADYMLLGPAISSENFTTAHRDTKIIVRVNTGCFSGSIDEFKAAIEKTHANNEIHLRQYRMFAKWIEEYFNL